MFVQKYFPPRFFAGRFWPGKAAEEDTGGFWPAKFFAERFFAPRFFPTGLTEEAGAAGTANKYIKVWRRHRRR